MKIRSFLASISCILALSVSAQQASVSSGGDISGSGGTVAYSIGQPVYTVVSSNEFSVGQGVQQPYKITPIGIAEIDLGIALEVYPNPTRDELILQIEGIVTSEYSYRLTDLSGKLIELGQISGNQTRIDASGLSAATYLLHVVKSGQPVQTFRIVKG